MQIATRSTLSMACFLGAASLTLMASSTPAAEVYVDARHGTDHTDGGGLQTPWKTLRFAVSQMKPDDTCVLRAGVYRETIKPQDGQTFRAYPNETTVISGCDVVGKWLAAKNCIWTATVSQSVRQLFLDGERLPKARYPDDDGDMRSTSDWAATVASRGNPNNDGSAEVTFSAWLAGKSFDGGFFTGMNGRNPFQANMGRIVRTVGDTLHCDQTNLRWYRSRPGEFDGAGRGYITDHLNALTTEKEWHWEKGTLHLMPQQGNALEERRVEARTRIYGFDCSGCKNVTIEGLVFGAASVLMAESQNCVIDGCDFTDVSPWGRFFDRHEGGDPEHYTYGSPEDGTAGIYISGEQNVIRNCNVAHGWGALITVRGRNNTVENNVVEDANWQCREFAVNIVVNGTDHRIIKNTVRTSTAMLIVMIDIDRVPTIRPQIQYNDCRDYAHVMLDGGTAAIYYNGNDDLGGGEISHNFIADNRTTNERVSCGIYLDDGSNNCRVHHNVIVGNGKTRCGLFTHKGNKRLTVYNNTFWDQKEAAWQSAVWEGTRDANSMIFRNNISGGKGFATTGVDGGIRQQDNLENVPVKNFVDVASHDFRLTDSVHGAHVETSSLGAYESGESWNAGANRQTARDQ